MACGLALGGCGTSAHDAVQAKVMQFAQAARAHDYATLCGQVLAPGLIRHVTAYGISCSEALRISLGRVRDPTLSIGEVTVKGRSASVITLSMAVGQQSELETITLTDTPDGWRIISLTPLTTPPR